MFCFEVALITKVQIRELTAVEEHSCGPEKHSCHMHITLYATT